MKDLVSVKDNNKENKMSSKKEKLCRGEELPVTEEDLEWCHLMADAQMGLLEDEDLKKTLAPQVNYADNVYLGEPFIDYVTAIYGQGGTEVPEFIPTRHELLQLVKYWEREDLWHKWGSFISSTDGDADWEIAAFASSRIARIAELSGEEEVKRAIDEVWEEFSRRCDPRRWDIFLHGDEEQWRAVQEEMCQEFLQRERRRRRLKEKENRGA